jgi:hypothetical protein
VRACLDPAPQAGAGRGLALVALLRALLKISFDR